MNKDQKLFLKYVRTKMVFSLRLRSKTEGMQPVHISIEEIEKRFLKFNRKEQIQHLVNVGELEATQLGKAFYYKALKPGGFDLSLIETKPLPDDRIIKSMVSHLKNAGMPPDAKRTEYFDLFLKYKLKAINLFFKVDDFSGRVYTPVTNQQRIHRPNLLLYGKETIGLDVQTMQPLLLGKILTYEIGENDFSKWLNEGKDIYLMLKDRSGINTRDEAKKRFFEIAFSPPNQKLAKIFGEANWINWINDYKSKPEIRNKKVKYLENESISYHNNLAWLLQNTEVQLMRKVWESLINAGIPFLSVHDEVIVQRDSANEALSIFSEIMKYEFPYFKINGKVPDLNNPILEFSETIKKEHEKVNKSKYLDIQGGVMESQIVGIKQAIFTGKVIEDSEIFNLDPEKIKSNPIKLSQGVIVTNPREFYKSHIEIYLNNKSNFRYKVYLTRIRQLEDLLTVK